MPVCGGPLASTILRMLIRRQAACRTGTCVDSILAYVLLSSFGTVVLILLRHSFFSTTPSSSNTVTTGGTCSRSVQFDIDTNLQPAESSPSNHYPSIQAAV